jgi:hypothetical protein
VTSKGYCFDGCLSASDCGYQTCNEYGLCGDQTPPGVTTKPSHATDDTSSDSSGGCVAASGEPLLLLALLFSGSRRRFRSAA